MAVGKVHVALPVETRDVMQARSEMVADVAGVKRTVGLREAVLDKTRLSVEVPGRRRQDGGGEFAARARPGVLARARDVEKPRRDERQQLVVVERQSQVLARPARRVVRREPIREAAHDVRDFFGTWNVQAVHARAGIAAAVNAPAHDEFIRIQIKTPRTISKTPRPTSAPNAKFGMIFSSDILLLIDISNPIYRNKPVINFRLLYRIK